MLDAGVRQLRLREHGRTTGISLDRAELTVLADPRARIRVIARPDGFFDVEASEVVGTLVGRNFQVEIEPKMPIRRLLFLLAYAIGIPEFTGTVSIEGVPDLMRAMALVYSEAMERALKRGPLNTYEARRDDLGTPRGRIDAMDLVLRKFGVLPPVACDFDEFTADNAPNRLLLAAAALLMRSGVPSGLALRRLRVLAGRLADVTEIRRWPRSRVGRPRDRRFDAYRPALGLAEQIVRHASVELRSGATTSVGLLVDMNTTFEDFVAEGLREALGVSEHLWVRHPAGLWLDTASRLPIYPDIVWKADATTAKLVIDAKYKTTSGVKNDDAYQMAAYCHALGLKTGVLVYAAAQSDAYVVRNSGPTIHVVSLNPDGEPDELRARLRDLADRLKQLAL